MAYLGSHPAAVGAAGDRVPGRV
ncbi:MAG: hypothetical protein QOI74_726, partial [Micromonosporaceae bacterium]|nr:hypothetical protein [Micromonosporaceae bacterium]